MPTEVVPTTGGSSSLSPAGVATGGRRTRRVGATAKQLKKMLKKAGLKVTGKKATLTKRAKKAHLKLVKKGGADEASTSGMVTVGGEAIKEGDDMGGRRRRSRRSRKFLGVF